MDISKILKYSLSFQKTAEYGPNKDSFMKVIEKANVILQKVLTDNKDYYSREYFGGKPFSVDVIDGNPSTSVILVNTNPPIQPAKGVEKATNVQYFEMEMLDKLMPLGVSLKVKNR